MPKIPTVSTILFIFFIVQNIFCCHRTVNSSQKNYCFVAEIAQESACFVFCNPLYQPSLNTPPMAVYLQRKNFSVELKKEGNRQCPLKSIGCFPSIMNDIDYFLDSSVIFFFSSVTFFFSAFSVFDSVVIV